MGVFHGSISYRRYFVEGSLPAEWREAFVERAQQYALQPLTAESEEEQAVGWATAQSVLDTEITYEKLVVNEYVILTLRTDVWRIPPTLYKAHLAEAEKQRLAEKETGKGLSRSEKVELRKAVRAMLKQRLLPSMSGIEMCWNLQRQEVRFWSHSKKSNEIFLEFFEKTFGQDLVPIAPYTLAEKMNLGEADKALLLEAKPTKFFPNAPTSVQGEG